MSIICDMQELSDHNDSHLFVNLENNFHLIITMIEYSDH